MTFSIGENIGPYRILEQLGQGGMATVFKAYHAGLDRFVAIKVMHPAFKQDPTFLARFQREARVVAKLEHPNIVPIYDYAEHNGNPYLVMKYIEGETLKARLGRSPLTREEGLRTVEAVGKALGYAHGRGILHRDIKPSNILLCPDNSIYLADFGLARIAQAGESTLSSEMLLGTPHYISPEQARGERNLDAGTDIYSFGVVLYEMVVGRVPFNADTPFSIIHDHIYTPLPLPQKINPRVPDSVQRVLLKALAKERADRYTTVEDLSAAFLKAVAAPGLGAAARTDAADTLVAPPTPPPMAAPGGRADTPPPAPLPAPSATTGSAPQPPVVAPNPKRRRAWLWVAGGLGLTLLCLFLLLAVASNQEGEPTASPGSPSPAVGATEDVRDPKVMAARATLAARPDDPEAHYALAEAEAEAGLPLLAARDYRKAADLFLRGRASLRASEAYLKAIVVLGGPEKAEEVLLDSTLKAAFTAGSDDPQGTLTLLEEAAKVLPDWPPLVSLGAHAQIAAGALDPARTLIETALAQDPQDGLALAVQAELLKTVGDRAGARQAAEAAQATGTIPAWLMSVLSESLGRPAAPELMTIGGEGTGPGLFTDARSMGMDEAGRIYVAEYDGGRVQVFDKQGVFLTQWFAEPEAPLRAIAVRRDGAVYTGQDGAIVLRDGQTGEPLSRLTYLGGSILNDVALLPDGRLLTAWYRNRDDVAVLDPGGETAAAIEGVVSQQTGEPELGLRVASDGQTGLWVLGEFSHAVFHFDGEGRFINRFGSAGEEPGQLSSPQSIAVDGKGRIYVGDFRGVQVFAGDGRLIGRVEVEGPCYGLFIDPGGRLWVANGTTVRQYEVTLP